MNKFHTEIAELPWYVLAVLFTHELHQFQSTQEIKEVLHKMFGIECLAPKIKHANTLLHRLELIEPFLGNSATYALTTDGQFVLNHMRSGFYTHTALLVEARSEAA